ncbi:TetR/AcrR family transcriptional regulator [Fructobacillus cardui]|uniref:TetR/AcrR family transcriptional regulator n=1 Tax=Fructobacillus cardui TaxID=2893170 RepID=UPI00200A1FC4|nr:TetR/AcrR family transcriptional regulator [Fructobacillus cardui]MCK8628186.1 TetR/AcrR family transcriptional regulator [Fructobacillus cardui]
MPKATFLNLNADKKEKISQVLLEEFSTYSLLDANVNHIVKAAGIARGSFYTYFADLDDAYRYTLSQVMVTIHEAFVGDNPFQATRSFIDQVEQNLYYAFLSNYYVVDEAILVAHHQETSSTNWDKATADLPQWLADVAVHHLIREYFLAPTDKNQILLLLDALAGWHKQEV